MTCLIAVVLTAIELHNLNLCVAPMAHHFRGDRAAVDDRLSDLNICAFAHHEYLVEFDRLACRDFKLLELEHFTFFYAVLLTTADNDCVHIFSFQLACSLCNNRIAGQSVGTRVTITNKGAENTCFCVTTQGQPLLADPPGGNKDNQTL
jgi:hypothetical protein